VAAADLSPRRDIRTRVAVDRAAAVHRTSAARPARTRDALEDCLRGLDARDDDGFLNSL
jgi:hypothetical protein